jgi:hypothetical protein
MGKFKLYATAIIGTVLVTSGLMGCVKSNDCDIDYDHAHLYSNNSGINRYIKSEKETIGDMSWSNQEKALDSDDEKLLRFLKNNGLYTFGDNKEYLDKIMIETKPHIEYEYEYSVSVIKNYVKVGKIYVPIYGTEVRKDFTTDANHPNLTGNVSDVYFQYTAYNVVLDYKGKYSINKSPLMDDIRDLEYTYNYFKEDDLFIKVYGPLYKANTITKK